MNDQVRPDSTAAILPSPATPRALVLAGSLLIGGLTLLCYFPALNGDFIWDDSLYLTKSLLIKAPDGLYRYWFTNQALDYWPVSNSSLWLEWRLWGMHPTGYHITNLILHIASALLIWRILAKLSVPGAFFAALLFAVHPVNVESVAWIAQRKGLLAMLFLLLSILWYLRAQDPPEAASGVPEEEPKARRRFTAFGTWYWLSLVAFVLAMLCKSSVAVLPVVLLALVWWRRGRISSADLVRTAPMFVAAIVLTGMTMWFQIRIAGEAVRSAGFAERLAGAAAAVWFYLSKAVLPIHLSFIYPQWQIAIGDFRWWLPLIAAVAITAILWSHRNSPRAPWARSILFAWGFFCAALVPVLGFTDVYFMKFALVADHYQYHALIAVVALAGAGWTVWYRRSISWGRSASILLGVMVVGALTFLTWQQSGLYRDPITIFQATIDRNPSCWMAYNNLGTALFDAGRAHESVKQFEQAIQLNPQFPEAHNNLGLALATCGRPEEAIDQCQQALALKPDYAEAESNLGLAFANVGRLKEAIEHCRQAIKLKADYPEAHNNLGLALANTGQQQEALEHYQKALQSKPDFPEAYNNLGNLLLHNGRTDEAIKCYSQALELKHNYPEAHCNLGLAFEKSGQFQEAIDHYQQALELRPDFVEAWNGKAVALVMTFRPEQALYCIEQALRLRPQSIPAYITRAMAYDQMHKRSDAISAAQSALDLAKSQGRTELAKEIETRLKKYRADEPENSKNSTPPAKIPSPSR